jgi:hypothetical protein
MYVDLVTVIAGLLSDFRNEPVGRYDYREQASLILDAIDEVSEANKTRLWMGLLQPSNSARTGTHSVEIEVERAFSPAHDSRTPF